MPSRLDTWLLRGWATWESSSRTSARNDFRELGPEPEERNAIEGEWAGRVTGLGNPRVEIAMMRTRDGDSQHELSHFFSPSVVAVHRNAPVNALGLSPRHVRRGRHRTARLNGFAKRGAQLVGEIVQYEDAYPLRYIRGPEGLLIGLAQELS